MVPGVLKHYIMIYHITLHYYGILQLALLQCQYLVVNIYYTLDVVSILDLLQKGRCSAMKGPTASSTVINLPPMPCELKVTSCVLFKNKVYVTGIATKDVVSRRVQVYSLEEVVWSTLPEAPSYNASGTIINGCFTLIGGRQSRDGSITNMLWSWIEKESRWEQRVPPMPTVRLSSGVCHHDNLLLVTGGIVDEETIKVANTIDVYNFSTNKWSTPEVLELPKALRSHHMVVFEDYIYLADGAAKYPAPPETGSSEAWRAQWGDVIKAVEQPSEAVKIVWAPITAPPAPRATLVAYRNHLFSVGGVNESIPQTAICRFVDGETDNHWEEVGSLNVGRFCHGVVPLESHATVSLLFVASGYVQGQRIEDEGNEKSNSVELVIL